MDKVHCNIIQDLLPLYADNVVSPESRAMVENHMAVCPECSEILEEIRASVPVPEQNDIRVLKKIRRKERWMLISPIIALILMLYIIIGEPALAFYLDSRIDYGPEDCIVSTDADGRPIIEMSERAKGANIYYLYDMNEEGMVDVYFCIDGNPEQFSPTHVLLGRILKWDFSADGIYVTPTLGLEPPHAHMSNYPSTRALHFDASVAAVYYLPISYDAQAEFINQYLWKMDLLGAEHMMEYEIPAIENRVLLWSAE